MIKLLLFFVLALPQILVAQPIAPPKDEAAMAQAFVAAIQSRDVNKLLALAPTAEVFRMTAPEETLGKTDAEIAEMAKPMYEKLADDFKRIQAEATKRKIELEKIAIKKQTLSGIPYSPKGFYVLEIFFTYKKKKGSFTVGITVINDTYYAYEIEKTTGVFKGMKG